MGMARWRHNKEHYYETDENGNWVKKSYAVEYTPKIFRVLITLTIIAFFAYAIITNVTAKDITIFPTTVPIVITNDVKIEKTTSEEINSNGDVVTVRNITFKIKYANTELKDIDNIVFSVKVRADNKIETLTTTPQSVYAGERYYTAEIKITDLVGKFYKVEGVMVQVGENEAYEPEKVTIKTDNKFNPVSIVVFMLIIIAFSVIQNIYAAKGRLQHRLENAKARAQVEQRAAAVERKKSRSAKKVCPYCGQLNNADQSKCSSCGAGLK